MAPFPRRHLSIGLVFDLTFIRQRPMPQNWLEGSDFRAIEGPSDLNKKFYKTYTNPIYPI